MVVPTWLPSNKDAKLANANFRGGGDTIIAQRFTEQKYRSPEYK
jgi:hypothetical protein